MTDSPRSGPALLIAACILTVTGTVCSVGSSTVNGAASTAHTGGDHASAHAHGIGTAISSTAPDPVSTADATSTVGDTDIVADPPAPQPAGMTHAPTGRPHLHARIRLRHSFLGVRLVIHRLHHTKKSQAS